MLVLSRQVGQEIRIAGNIVIRIEKISGSRVSVGIIAPPETKIVREELLNRNKESEGGK